MSVKTEVLELLQSRISRDGLSDFAIAHLINRPVPSVRRSRYALEGESQVVWKSGTSPMRFNALQA